MYLSQVRHSLCQSRYAHALPASRKFSHGQIFRARRSERPHALRAGGDAEIDASFIGTVQHLESGTVTWGYYKFGPLASSKTKAALLLIPGMGLTTSSWGTELLFALAQDRELYVPDNPGMGFSKDTGDTSGSAEAATQAYVDLVTKLDLNKPDILGWSYGGGIGLCLALDHGSKFGKVVNIAGDFGGPGGDPGPQAAKAGTGKVQDQAEVFFPDTSSGKRGAQRYIRGVEAMPEDPVTPATIELQFKAAQQYHQPGQGIKSRLADIQNPVLSIQGQDDDFVPASVADVLVNTLPHIYGVRFPGAKHGVLFQYLDFSLAAIKQFLDEATDIS